MNGCRASATMVIAKPVNGVECRPGLCRGVVCLLAVARVASFFEGL